MNIQAALKLIASVAAGIVLIPFLQTPAAKLAEKLNFDTILSDQWEPLMSLLSSLSGNPWYIFIAGVIIGFPIALWLEFTLRRKEVSPSASDEMKSFENVTPIINKVFRNQEIVLDNKKYIHCKFYNVTVMYDGGPLEFSNNEIYGMFFKIGTKDFRASSMMRFLQEFNLLKIPSVSQDGKVVVSTTKWHLTGLPNAPPPVQAPPDRPREK